MSSSLNNLSFNELKKLLNQTDDPIKITIIRRLMLEHYKAYKKNLKENAIKNKNREKQYDKLLDGIIKEKTVKSYDKVNELDEMHKSVSYADRKFNPIQRDALNSNLNNRLNSDIYINKKGFRDIRYKPKEIVPAFYNNE